MFVFPPESFFTGTSGYDDCFIFSRSASNLFEIKEKFALSVI